MAYNLRLCLYDPHVADAAQQFFDAADPEGDTPLASLTRLTGIDIVARCTDWKELQQHLRMGTIDVVVVNLDGPAGERRFLPVQRIAELAPECALVGVSHDTNPETILAAMRAGCSQFVPVPIREDDLRAAFERIRQIRVPGPGAGLLIGVLGAHGGAGGTTVACNLALELARVAKERIALVDMDLQFGDIACAFDRQPRFSLGHVCRDATAIDRSMLERALEELPCNVSILARPDELEDAVEVSDSAIERTCQTLGRMFPFVVLDLPRYFSPAMLAAARTTDRILIVSQVAVPFLRNASRVQRGLIAAELPADRVEFVLNRCNAEHERIAPEDIEHHFGRRPYGVIPNDYKRVTVSRDLGHPILASSPDSPARLAIQALAQRLITDLLGMAPEGATPLRRGLFSFLWGGRRAPTSAVGPTAS